MLRSKCKLQYYPAPQKKYLDVLPTLPILSAPVGEPYFSDYSVHELPDSGDQSSVSHSVSSFGMTSRGASGSSAPCPEDSHTDEGSIIVNTALLARIEALQAANKRLQDQLDKQKPKCFRLESIKDDDKLVHFYTGFQS